MTDSDYEFNIEQRVSYLEGFVQHQATQISALQELCEELKPASKLTFMETLSPKDLNRIVKLRADLFHNPNAKQGTPKWDLKLFVWFDKPKGNSGSIQPLHFWLQPAERMDIQTGDESLLGCLTQRLGSSDMVGCLSHRGSKFAKGRGTIRHKDHVVIRRKSELLIWIDDWRQEFDDYEAMEGERKPGAPVARWWWNKSQC